MYFYFFILFFFYLDQQIHNVSRHLLNQDVDHPEDLCLGSSKGGSVNVLLRLGVGLGRVEAMNLGIRATIVQKEIDSEASHSLKPKSGNGI